eukprot:scaffold32210_cov48-Cyclotella_meneghiniana.AAC.1
MDSFSINDDCISYYFQGGSGKEKGFIVQSILIIWCSSMTGGLGIGAMEPSFAGVDHDTTAILL